MTLDGNDFVIEPDEADPYFVHIYIAGTDKGVRLAPILARQVADLIYEVADDIEEDAEK
jgi:hypothetical protein